MTTSLLRRVLGHVRVVPADPVEEDPAHEYEPYPQRFHEAYDEDLR